MWVLPKIAFPTEVDNYPNLATHNKRIVDSIWEVTIHPLSFTLIREEGLHTQRLKNCDASTSRRIHVR